MCVCVCVFMEKRKADCGSQIIRLSRRGTYFIVCVCVCTCRWATWKHLVHTHGSSGIVSRCVCLFWPHCVCIETNQPAWKYLFLISCMYFASQSWYLFAAECVHSFWLRIISQIWSRVCVCVYLSALWQTNTHLCVCVERSPVKGQPDGQDNDYDQTL